MIFRVSIGVAVLLMVSSVLWLVRPSPVTATAAIIIHLHDDDPPNKEEHVRDRQLLLIEQQVLSKVARSGVIRDNAVLRHQTDATQWLRDNIVIRHDGSSIVLSLTSASNPSDVKDVVDAVARIAVGDYRDDHSTQMSNALQMARMQMSQLRRLAKSPPLEPSIELLLAFRYAWAALTTAELES